MVSWNLQNTMTTALIIYILTMLYSLFMAYVGWKQARVYKLIKESNVHLAEIKKLLVAQGCGRVRKS